MTTPIETALAVSPDTRELLVGAGVLEETPGVARTHLGEAVTVVADTITWDVAGRRVEQALRAAGLHVADPLVLPGSPAPHADTDNVDRVVHHLSASGARGVAVGSGTLNDLTKRASHLLGEPYVVVATAPSMDGYTAVAAPITVNGFKTSLPCPAPVAVVADLDVLAAAPVRMTASGYGDLLGKIPAGACWLVAEAAGAEAVDRDIWPYLQEPFRAALARPDALGEGDRDAFRGLIEGLVLSGLTIQIYGSSRPGSGMEHLMSHLWEMQGLGADAEPPLSHGAKVGVGSVAAAALYGEVLRADLGALDVDALVAAWPARAEVAERVRALLPRPELVDTAVEQTLAKHLEPAAARVRLEGLRSSWPVLRDDLARQMLTPQEMQRRLRAVGGPAHPHDIGLTLADLRRSYEQAQVIRNRYTVLDLVVETRTLGPMLDRLFAPDGFWGAQAASAPFRAAS